MKTNLDKKFKANADLETKGVWFEVEEGGPKFLVSRYSPDTKGVKEEAAKVTAPFRAQISLGTISESNAQLVMVKTFVHACVKDWSGVEIDGEFPDFSRDLCVKLFLHVPQIYRVLEAYASDINNYRDEVVKQ